MGQIDRPDGQALAELDRALFETYQHRCVGCLINKAVCIHEIGPRSKHPADWFQPSNRVPLCSACHDRVHSEGTEASTPWLYSQREMLLRLIYG